MDKINVSNRVTADYNRQAFNDILTAIQTAINRGADGYLFPVTSVTANYTQSPNDSIILVNATSGAITVTLQPALQCEQKRLTIKKTDSSGNAVTIDANGAETIDGSATKSLATQYKAYELVAQGGSWWIVSAI